MDGARWVRLDDAGLERTAALLDAAPAPGPHPAAGLGFDPHGTAGCVMVMAALNFGSGWWPTVRRRPGMSGASTMMAGLMEAFRVDGPPTADGCEGATARRMADVLGQGADHPLMAAYAATLRDLGTRIRTDYGGDWLGPLRAGGGDAAALVDLLLGWDAFADTARYGCLALPFAKRAQLAVADLHRAGAATVHGLERLTAFADNLVPHTLAVEGALRIHPDLAARIAAEALLEPGGAEEVELRAAAVVAVERLAALTGRPAYRLDALLWAHGRSAHVKARPRPRVRQTAY